MRLPVLPSLCLGLSLLLTACSQPITSAEWQLDSDASHLGFVSIKANEIAEVHRFSGLSGSVDADGRAELVIDLATVDTGIAVRDGRMREHFFETAQFPQARVTARLDLVALADMETGDRRPLTLDATLDLHGISAEIDAEIMVTDLGGQHILVESRNPVLLHVADFELVEGLATLQEMASLSSITPVSPVNFSLVFTRG